MGVDADVEVTDSITAAASLSDENVTGGTHTSQVLAKVAVKATDNITVQPYGVYTRKTGSTSSTVEQGKRADAGIKILYAWDDDQEAFIFGQGTALQTGTMHRDDRGGVGGSYRLTEKIKAEGEVSGGSLGLGVNATLAYEPTADNRYYIGYTSIPPATSPRTGPSSWSARTTAPSSAACATASTTSGWSTPRTTSTRSASTAR